ncbi:MAG: S8 family serine peptidase [Candidatus Margulisbacteria bacterium]|jgi:subtilisin family serine protease|nr:S8 family serine peptidase [Candidatus Margulisiibacteriota bacterium]
MARIIFFCLCCALLWAEYLPNKILVELKPADKTIQSLSAADVSPRLEKLLNNYGPAHVEPLHATALHAPRGYGLLQSAASFLDNYYAVEYPSSINVEMLVEILKNDPEVADAQPVFIYRIQAIPNDSDYSNQAWYFDLISAPAGWDIATGGATVKIAILDTGVSLNHPDLKDKLLAGYDFANNDADPDDDHDYTDSKGRSRSHGTTVTGLAAASGDNGQGIAGLDWNARIIPIKVMDSSGEGRTDDIIKGIRFAVEQGADVLNMSLGQPGYDQALEKACEDAVKNGVILVAAGGNTGGENPLYPAAYASVLSVGSVGSVGNRSWFSVKRCDVMAPGESMYSTVYFDDAGDNGYANNGSGTSYAAPLVSGLMGLLRAQDPNLKPQEALEIVKKTAKPAGNYTEYGWGIIDVYHALTRTPYSRDSGGGKNLKVLSAPNPAQKAANFSFAADQSLDSVRIYIYDQRGRKVQELDYGGSLLGGVYVTPEWDLLGSDGRTLANGSYIYVVKATARDGSVSYGKNILSVVR